MTTTVLELLENLKHYPGATKISIKTIDAQEFTIVNFVSQGSSLNIVLERQI